MWRAWVFYTSREASRVEERIKDMSTQGKEKVDHVWMEAWTKWDQNNEGVGNNAVRLCKESGDGKLNERQRDDTDSGRQESGGRITGRGDGEGGEGPTCG